MLGRPTLGLTLILRPFLGYPILPRQQCERGVCVYCPQSLHLPLPRGLAYKVSPGPLLSSPKSKSATPTPPPGPSPCSHFLIWVYHTGRKRNFSLQAGLGGGVSPGPWGSQEPPSKAHLLHQATPPAPPSHSYLPHPAGKEPRAFQVSGLTG